MTSVIPLNPDLSQIFSVLSLADFSIRLVGGAVRDNLLNRHIKDFDFAAECRFSTLLQFLQTSACSIVHTHADHGSVKCILLGITFDITILRKDISTDGRHASIECTSSWFEDASRRDFTINALYQDFTGQIYDPLGLGLQDLKDRKLRFIGDAAARIQEDYLRILRFFRLSAELDLTVNQQELQIVADYRKGIARLSRERVRHEISRILGTACYETLYLMEKMGVLTEIFPGLNPKINHLQTICPPNLDWQLRLAILFLYQPTVIHELSRQLTLSKQETNRLKKRLTIPDQPLNPKVWIYCYGRTLSVEYLWLYRDSLSIDINDINHLRETFKNIDIPYFPLLGKDFLELGLSGAQLGKARKVTEKIWLESACTMDAKELQKAIPLG